MAYLPFSNGLSALICGNNWNNGVHCGPRTVNANNSPWNVNPNIGARRACGENMKKKTIISTRYRLRS